MAQHSIPIAPPGELPDCHAEGVSPEGYGAEELVCEDCVDKLSCLPAAVKNPRVWTVRGARVWALRDDAEVEAAVSGEMSYEAFVGRMIERTRLREAGKLVPARLLVRRGAAPEQPAAPAVAAKKPAGKKTPPPGKAKAKPVAAAAKRVGKPAAASNGVAKKSPKATKPAAKKAPARAQEKRPSVAPAARRAPASTKKKNGTPIARNGKPLPVPRAIDEAQMARSLARIKLGKPVDFEVGMTIERKTRDGGGHEVALVKTGYLYSGDQQIYPSLSAVAMVASGTPNRSGNDYYNLVTSRATRVVGRGGKLLADYRS